MRRAVYANYLFIVVYRFVGVRASSRPVSHVNAACGRAVCGVRREGIGLRGQGTGFWKKVCSLLHALGPELLTISYFVNKVPENRKFF